MDDMVLRHHKHLKGAKIGAAWALTWKENKDGQVHLGKAKKCSELDRQLHGFDLVVILNQDIWLKFNCDQREALMRHELCHFEIKRDKDGQALQDEKNRTLFRIRRHDVEEFTSVIQTHGLWTKGALMEFARACIEKSKTPLLELPSVDVGTSAPAPEA